MATLTNPQAGGESQVLKIACEGILSVTASQVLTEPVFNIGSITPQKTYLKRQEFAKKILANPKLYADQLADMVEYIEPNFVFNCVSNGQDLYRYLLLDNPANRNVMEMKYDQVNRTHTGTQSGVSLFDIMAGVSAIDYA